MRSLAIVFVAGICLALVVTTGCLVHQQLTDRDSHPPHLRPIIITVSMIPVVVIVGYVIVKSV